jgi:endoplasmic reticulum protein 29
MMCKLLFSALLLLTNIEVVVGTHVKGALSLDSFTFPKVVGGDRAVLLKFDKDYAYGEKEDAFKALAERVGGGSDDVIIASVAVQEYGDKLNEDLAARFGVNKDNFPVYKLFAKGSDKAHDYTGEVKTDDLIRFLKENVDGFYVALPGCIKELDSIASEFMSTSGGGRNLKREEAEIFVSGLEKEADKDNANFYLLVMKKVNEKGDGFITTETVRLNKMLDSTSITEARKSLFRTRLNILPSFKAQKQDL